MVKTAKTCFRYVYLQIPDETLADNTKSHRSLQRQGTYGLMRRILVVGPDPPITVLQSQEYQASLQASINPPLVWPTAARNSLSIRTLMSILISNDFELIGLLPPYINQFPDNQSEKIDIISVSLTNNDVRRMDDNVREVVTNLCKDIVLIIGACQTHITPTVGFQRSLIYETCVTKKTWYACQQIAMASSSSGQIRLGYGMPIMQLKSFWT
jgi:uncharacterized Zn-finger protein